MAALTYFALSLQLLGTVLSAYALLKTYGEHGDVHALRAAVRQRIAQPWLAALRLLRADRREVTVVAPAAAAGSIALAGDPAVITDSVQVEKFPDELSYLRAAHDQLARRVEELDKEHRGRHDDLSGRLERVRQDLHDVDQASRRSDAALASTVKTVAIGTIRLQMGGVICVGVGTILSLWA